VITAVPTVSAAMPALSVLRMRENILSSILIGA
jgi:hypothetical protein